MTKEEWEKSVMKFINGDSLLKLKTLKANSIDSVATDPPYGLSFMNKKWDYDIPSKELWIEVLRVLKPGGHLLSFGGTRTYHRMVVAIEDASFEIRDQVQWLYGSGFPKSHNIKEGKFEGWGTALKVAIDALGRIQDDPHVSCDSFIFRNTCISVSKKAAYRMAEILRGEK